MASGALQRTVAEIAKQAAKRAAPALENRPRSCRARGSEAADYLNEVRVFSSTSADFAKIAASLGVDATLPTLGAGASLVVAIRNDSGEAIDSMRLLFQVEKGGPPFP